MGEKENMSQTNVSDFQKLIKRIPNDRFKNIVFFPIIQNGKNPDVPKGERVLNHRLNVNDCFKRLKSGKNVGVYGLAKGIMILELDVDEQGDLYVSNNFIKLIPDTFTVKSPSGGLHFYFLNDGEYGNQVSAFHKIEFYSLRSNMFYVVAPGSWYSGKKGDKIYESPYKVINDAPIASFVDFANFKKAEIKNNDLQAYLLKMQRQEETQKLKLEEHNQKMKDEGKIYSDMSQERKEALIWQLKNKIPRS